VLLIAAFASKGDRDRQQGCKGHRRRLHPHPDCCGRVTACPGANRADPEAEPNANANANPDADADADTNTNADTDTEAIANQCR
jgi:hypothetical protein